MKRKSSKKNGQKKNHLPAVFILNAILWVGYGIYIYYDMAVLNRNTGSADVVTLFVFINALVMLASGLLLKKNEIETYYFALVVAALNTLLMLFNLLDPFFFASFILDLIILWILIPQRRRYLPKS